MTFYDAINKLINKIDTKLNYPINVIMGYDNSKYIDYELFDNTKKIDEILEHPIINSDDMSIKWENENSEICSESLNNLYVLKGNVHYEIEKSLNSFEYMGRTQDNKFNIYLHLLPEDQEITIDGINYLDGDIQLPNFNHFKYQNLYSYQNENSFINAIYIEFITRNARYNNLLSDLSVIEESPLEDESEEEFDLRMTMLEQEIEERQNKILLQAYGLTSYEIMQLDLTLYKEANFESDHISSIQLSTVKPPHKKVYIDPELSEEDFFAKAKELRDYYHKSQNDFFPLKEKINKEYHKQTTNVINKFPESFKKKQDDLIKALFIFDYIFAGKKIIDKLNAPITKEYKSLKIQIIKNYNKELNKIKKEIQKFESYKKEIVNSKEKDKKQKRYNEAIDTLEKDITKLKKDTKKKLCEIKVQLKQEISNYPKMDPSKYKESVFHEIASIIDEKPGQCKKLYNHLYKFIENKIL